MRRIALTALLALAALSPLALGQRGPEDRADRRVAMLMDDLRTEMWSFRQELDFFKKLPVYAQLLDIRLQLRNQAVELVKARDFNDQGTRRLVRQMEREARDLYHLAEHLEDSLDPRNHPEVRRRADSLHEHAVEIRVIIGRLEEVIHLDRDDGGPRGRPRPPLRDDAR